MKVDIQVLDYMVKKPKHGLEPDSVYGRDTTKRPYHHGKTYELELNYYTSLLLAILTSYSTTKRSQKHTTTTSPPPPNV